MLVFIDESGDPGISSNLRYFVIAVLIFDDPRQALLMQRQITHLLSTFGKSEFKFSKSKAAERDTFFYEIDKFDFRVGAIMLQPQAQSLALEKAAWQQDLQHLVVQISTAHFRPS